MKATIYNEDTYLNGNPEALDKFSKVYDDRKKIWQAEKEVYSETIDQYNAFIDRVAVLVKNLGYNSSIECSLILSYLIKNGFLSANLSFTGEAINEENELSCCFGTTIINGQGCCRNFVGLHKDVFERLGLYFKNLYCYEGLNTFNRAANARANHVVSLIEHDGNCYAIDLYNGNRLYRFKSPLILREISFNSSIHLRYKPYYELLMGESSLEDIKKTLATNQELAKLKHINPFDYEDYLRIETQNRLRRVEDQLYVFHEETKTLKKTISETITRIGE